MQRDIDNVGGAVAGVGYQAKDRQPAKIGQRKGRPEVRPCGYKPDQNDGSENQVIDKATWLPEAHGIGPKCSGLR